MIEWISVKDRIPEEDIDVLVARKEKWDNRYDYFIGRYEPNGDIYKKEWICQLPDSTGLTYCDDSDKWCYIQEPKDV